MITRILGVGALIWGIVVFILLNTVNLTPSPQIFLSKSVEFGVSLLSITWLISSSLVKIGLILGKKWLKVSIISCLCFILMIINIGVIQASFPPETSRLPDPSLLRLFNLVSLWFISWFWIDLLVIGLVWIERRINKWKRGNL